MCSYNDKIIISIGNIVDDCFLCCSDVIVNPTNPKMRYGMGVSEAIFRKAGIDSLEKYCEIKFGVGYSKDKQINDMKPAEVRVTPGFSIPCDILFAQGTSVSYFNINEEEIIPLFDRTYKNVFKECIKRNYKKILLPSLGTGHYGIDHVVASKVLIDNAKQFLDVVQEATITLVLFEPKYADMYRKLI